MTAKPDLSERSQAIRTDTESQTVLARAGLSATSRALLSKAGLLAPDTHIAVTGAVSKSGLVSSQSRLDVESSQSKLNAESSTTKTSQMDVKKKRLKKKKLDPYLIPGVTKLVLSEVKQKTLGISVGNNVTAENPWTMVKKAQIIEDLDLYEGSSEFLPVKKDILKYAAEEVLVGYGADESKDEDEFYICATENAYCKLQRIIEKNKRKQVERLENSIHKKIKEWVSMGSEIQLDESLVVNHRPLLEIEVEAVYPAPNNKAEFQISQAQARRDGYTDLKPGPEERIVNVTKLRIDNAVQVAPQYRNIEVQTTFAYPSNAATQYEYEAEDPAPLLQLCLEPIKEYAAQHLDNLADMLRVNGEVDLYSEDYFSLIKDDAKYVTATVVEDVKAYLSFMDVELCKGKVITDIAFHPMWSGTVAVAYSDSAPFIYKSGPNTDDVVSRFLEGANPVLIWSCLDSLKPKLILQTPRDIMKLAFCKFDENILIGGMTNGQIIIWDIRNKLEQVESSFSFTTAQLKYKTYMASLMGWMKNTYDVSVLRPTAVSNLKYSHSDAVTGINWVSPFQEFTKKGKLLDVPENAEPPHSMQFITGGADGFILFWDLLKVPQATESSYKPRKLKRLKERPRALEASFSPLTVHHLTLTPIYKVVVPRRRKVPFPAAHCNENLCPMEYVEVNPVKTKKKVPIHERIIFKPVMDRTRYERILPQVHLGTMEGDYVHCKWEGQEFDSGDAVNSEVGIATSRGKYHDGPVNTAQKNLVHNVILTVGGRAFALWKEGLADRPIIWRKSPQVYTSGEWSIQEPYIFTNKLVTGDVESWNISFDSKNPAFSMTFSSGYLTASAFHSLKIKKQIYAAADKLGSLRLFFMPEDSAPGTPEAKNQRFADFLDREVMRKNRFLKWQKEWNERQALMVAAQATVEEEEGPVTKKEQSKKALVEEEIRRQISRGIIKPEIQPGTFVDFVIQQRKLQQDRCIKETIVAKKQLDTKELEKRRKPLQKLEEENERKKKKQKQRVKDGENIFNEIVASLFPDVVKEKPPPPPDPYTAMISRTFFTATYNEFLEVKEEAGAFVKSHPYVYQFNWKQLIADGQKRRNVLGDRNGAKQKIWRSRGSRVSEVTGLGVTVEEN